MKTLIMIAPQTGTTYESNNFKMPNVVCFGENSGKNQCQNQRVRRKRAA